VDPNRFAISAHSWDADVGDSGSASTAPVSVAAGMRSAEQMVCLHLATRKGQSKTKSAVRPTEEVQLQVAGAGLFGAQCGESIAMLDDTQLMSRS
jgi:hypothetical protein